jgi:hypothetical protein
MERRGFLGFLAGAGVIGAARAPKTVMGVDVGVGESKTATALKFGGQLVVVRVDDATMAKIQAGPGGISNGVGSRYYDGSEAPPMSDELKERRQAFLRKYGQGFDVRPRSRPENVGIIADGGELPGSRGYRG